MQSRLEPGQKEKASFSMWASNPSPAPVEFRAETKNSTLAGRRRTRLGFAVMCQFLNAYT
jgi:hypothetical protein